MAARLVKSGRLLVVGAGRSGMAAAAAARRLMPEARITLSDSRREALSDGNKALLEGMGIEIETGRSDLSLLDGCSLVIKSPGIPAEIPLFDEALRRGIPVWGEIEFAWRFLPNLIAGVTGTNGKTTTTELIGHIFRHAGRSCRVAGNVGTALSSFAGEATGDEVMVVELSSFQLEDSVLFRPDIAVLLNLTEDHLDRHQDMESYAAAKQRIFLHQTPDDVAVLNLDDPGCRRSATGSSRKVWFSAKAPPEKLDVEEPPEKLSAGNAPEGRGKSVAGTSCQPLVFVARETIFACAQELELMGSGLKSGQVRPGELWFAGEEKTPLEADRGRKETTGGEVSAEPEKPAAVAVAKWAEVPMKGRHNLENSLAAVAVCLILGLSPGQVAEGLKSFPGVRHRLQEVRVKDGVLFVNDSKATNVDAAVRALSAFSGGIHLIVGGSSKGCSFDELARAASGGKVRQVIVIGQSGPEIAASFAAQGRSAVMAAGLEQAVKEATQQAQAGDVVLLAPACASFDQYRNYEERGEHFIHLVNNL